MKLVRHPLPKTRRWKLTNKLGNNLVGVLNTYLKPPKFAVWKAHSRWAWWKFYRSDK